MQGGVGARKERIEMVAAGAQLAAAGVIVSGEGNLSIRIGPDRILVTPRGVDKGRLRAVDLVVMPLESAEIPRDASSEARLHAALYQRYPRINAVVHAHPPGVQALAARFEVPDVHLLAEGPELVDRIGWIGSYPAGSEELAQAVAGGLEDAQACVLAQHGAVAVGATMAIAMRRMFLLERLSRLTRSMLKS
jgi:L-fuculose-phosphate aldolase